MAQIRRINVSAKSKDRVRVSLDAMIVVEPGVLTRGEVDDMKRVVADRLMLFVANEIPYLHAHLSEIKVTR